MASKDTIRQWEREATERVAQGKSPTTLGEQLVGSTERLSVKTAAGERAEQQLHQQELNRIVHQKK